MKVLKIRTEYYISTFTEMEYTSATLIQQTEDNLTIILYSTPEKILHSPGNDF